MGLDESLNTIVLEDAIWTQNCNAKYRALFNLKLLRQIAIAVI